MIGRFGRTRPDQGERRVCLSQLSAITWETYLTVLPSPVPRRDTRILRVAFSGTCGVGSDCAKDVVVMESVCLMGLWTWQAQALILDFTDLTYVWGDDMVALLELPQAAEVRHRDLRLAVVTSVHNEPALRSLVAALGQDPPVPLFKTRRAAFDWLVKG